MKTIENTTRWSRRGVLAGAASIFAGAAWTASRARAAALRGLSEPTDEAEPPRTLLILELSGGNDGLTTVVPYTDPLYAAARTRTAIAADQVLRIDEQRGLHPHLAGLRKLWDERCVAIVEGVGYPRPNRSHFTSFDIWHTARASGRASGEGWIGRYLSAKHPGDAAQPHAVHVGPILPYSLTSPTHPVVHLETPSAYRWVSDARAIAGAGELPAQDAVQPVRDLRAVIRGADVSSNAIRQAVGRHHPRVEYPDSQLARELAIVAAIVQAQIGIEVLSVTQTGYDTHDNQRPRQDGLLAELDAALSAFVADMRGTPAGDRLVVLVFSEFGRRVADNASQGSDHGTAGPVFLLGSAVRGGFYGKPCSLSELDEGDLVQTTDFRNVYASVLASWLGVAPETVLGASYPTLPVLG